MSDSNNSGDPAEEVRSQTITASSELIIKTEDDDLVEIDATISSRSSDDANFPHLRQATTAESVEILDSYKTIGLSVLDDLRGKLERIQGSSDAVKHGEALGTLRKQAQNRKTILGVVGSTGQGKSSLINALLGERRLIPTNCARACTAVITEISWNDSQNPDHRYVAEVEYVSRDEWGYELDLVFRDLKASQSESLGSYVDGDVDVRVALAKIKAVYPHITSKGDLAQTNIASLLDEPTVNSCLGTTQTIYGSEATRFNQDVSQYVDSLQKGVANGAVREVGDTDEKQSGMQLWPLIKVVRIYTKADVLSTGAVIVDLPGVEDSNAARAAVAAKYLEKCNAIWVVAAINRAVNDKTAQKLLGQSFKQQLNYDGNYSRVTFVCSKTDDITMVEAAETFGLGYELEALNDKEAAAQEWDNEGTQQLQNDQERSQSLYSYLGELDRRLSHWEKLETRQRKGQEVIASQIPSKKRKASTQRPRATKRLRRGTSESSGDSSRYISAGEFWDDLETGLPVFHENELLNEEQIRSMIDNLRTKKNAALEENERLEEKIQNASETSNQLDEDYEQAKANLLSLCIQERSSYTRDAMRSDFANGLRELDQENSLHENPDDTGATIRDYDNIARSLQVFCVSSKAYHELSKQSRSSFSVVEGFNRPEDTEIPQLIAHAKKLTESIRSETDKSFLNGLLQAMHSLYMWCDVPGNELAFSDEERRNMMDAVKDGLVNLDQDLMKVLGIFVQKCKYVLTKDLFTQLESSSQKAAREAPKIAGGWPQMAKNDEGLPCTSYKSACRREGVYSGTLAKRDFNEELVRPFKRGLANKWVSAFQQTIPEALDEFTRSSEQLLQSFHDAIKVLIQKKASFTTLNTLRSQLAARALGITHTVNSFSGDMVSLQREASRKTNPVIKEQMKGTYSTCAGESGKGCFIRIQNHMLDDLEKNGELLFKAAADPIKKDLTNLCELLENGLRTKIANMLDGMQQDYNNVILGQDGDERVRKGRKEILKLLKEVDAQFK